MVLLAAALFIGMPFASAADEITTPPTDGVDEMTKNYIVGFHEAIPRGIEVGSTYKGGEVIKTNPALDWIVVQTDNPVQFQVESKMDDRVRYVEWDNPHYASTQLTPNDEHWNHADNWGPKRINADIAWDTTTGSTAVKVGVIDSGLRKTHEEFSGSGRVLQGHDFHNGDSDPNDDCGHGTHVAGTIGATLNNGLGIAGMAQATILPIKGLGQGWLGCTGSTSALADSLQYAADQGAQLSSNSWGGGSSTTLNDAIQYAYNAGTTQIAAAGNDGPCSNCVGEPWASNPAEVIIVASSTSSDAQSSFSNEGPEIDVIAPGSSILSAYNGNDGDYATLSGTSMATPHVTGVAALMLAVDGSLTYSDIDSTLKSTAEDLGLSSDAQGDGLVRADSAVAAVGGGGG
ncbi:MAG: S8 family serine peptidase, partial [Candidatus Thermoplasmatota archaeon]|nr:S8 family serine peptidase [Candidatus Thermoplasmatota archaeon]